MPIGPGWEKIRKITGTVTLRSGQVPFEWVTLVVGAILFYATFFGLGRLGLGYYKSGAASLVIAVIAGVYLWKRLKPYDVPTTEDKVVKNVLGDTMLEGKS